MADAFERHLAGTGVASWLVPKGGYFISLEVPQGCAQSVVGLAKNAGVELTPAGATHPHGHDPDDRTIRIAPTFPELSEITQAAEGVANQLGMRLDDVRVESQLVGGAFGSRGTMTVRDQYETS